MEHSIQTFLKDVQTELGDHFKMISNESHSCCFQTTPKRWKEWLERPSRKKDRFMKTDFYVMNKNSGVYKISHPQLDHYHHLWTDWDARHKEEEQRRIHEMSKEWLSRHSVLIDTFHQEYARFTCLYHLATFFKKHSFHSPMIAATTDKSVRLRVKNMRHLLMEQIHSDSLFVPFHVDLNPDQTGYLIYGMNSSGKSTYLKSIGVAVWLAQCGLFVPASEFVFTPFDALYSKIGVNDNLFLGQSTFVSEMSELRFIMERVSSKSLVLCDELTSGTETRSATGLVASTILEFLFQKVCFFMTTHLHSVAELPEIHNHPSLKICHFETDVVPRDKPMLSSTMEVHFDRLLKDGSGNDTYGVEIAEKIGVPSRVIDRAKLFRKRISIHVDQPMRISRYNPKLLMDVCRICGNDSGPLHTHHIVPQKLFSPDDHNKKDMLCNLIVLCETCHMSLHHHS